MRRVALFAGMVLCAVNLWTGGPLLAIWVGSKAQGGMGASMGAIGIVVLVLVVVEVLLVLALGRLTALYDEATGFHRRRHQTAWLRAMSGERQGFGGVARRIAPSERILAAIVVVAVLTFEVWFFFFAGSSLPNA